MTITTVFADSCMPANWTEADWQEASKVRQLRWRGDRMTLAEAAKAFSEFTDGYNEFNYTLLEKLDAAFPGEIEITPARESSVAVYLHIPDNLKERVEHFVAEHFSADEVDFEDGLLRIWWD